MNKKSRNTIIGSIVVAMLAVIAAVVVSGISFWNSSVDSEAAGRPVTVDSVTIQGTDVVAQISCKSIPSSDDGVFYLYADEVYEDGATGKVVATTKTAKSATLTFPLNLNSEDSNLSRKFLVVVKQGGNLVQVSDEHYITNPEAVATYTSIRNDHGIKGLLADLEMEDAYELSELGLQQVIYNFDLGTVCGLTDDPAYPTIEYTYDGTTYYFNGHTVTSYDTLISQWNNMGLQVTMVILNSDDVQSPYTADLMHPDSRDGHECPGYAFNTAEEGGTKHLKAIAAFLGERYSGMTGHGQVDNWCIGNEVNARTEWYYLQSDDLDTNVNAYVKAFRIFYNGIKSMNGSANIYNSIDQEWNRKSNPGCFLSKAYLDTFNYYMNREGNINWGLSFHPYNSPLFDPYAWKGQSQYVSRNIKTPYITMQNIDVLIDYMHQADFLAPDGSVRSISLAEQGYTSSFGEDYQSASLVYSYLMAASYPDIDAFLLFRQTDNAHEMESNLALGLNNLDGTHKPAYYFYQAMGAANQQEYIDKASNIIGMDVQYLVDNRILLTRSGWSLND